MPRPQNIIIQGHLIRRLRNQLNLSQRELAQRVYTRRGSLHIPDRDVLERRCRDWEVDNRVSREMLSALAAELKVTPAHLQHGGAPDAAPSRIADVAEKLRAQVTAGVAPARRFIDGVRELSDLEVIPPLNSDDEAYVVAAVAIECRLGSAQLVGDRAELKTIAELLNWEGGELHAPAASHPYWLVKKSGAFGEQPLRLTHGTSKATSCVVDSIEAWFEDATGQERIVIEDDGPWIRIHLKLAGDATLDETIHVVRCEATETGLRYTKPSELERRHFTEHWFEVLHRYLKQMSPREFNSPQLKHVRDFVGPVQPFQI